VTLTGTDWSREVAVVTGAAGSIGAATADHLAALGARVAGSDYNAEAANGARRRMDRVDATNSSALDRWIDDVERAWGTPTIAVICAGISKAGRLAELSDSDWRDVLAVNLDGAFYTTRAVIRHMLAANLGGRIVFVGSWAAHAPHPHIGSYSISKAGLRSLCQTLARLRSLCQTLALEHAQDDILVNEVAPGIVDAGLSRALFRDDPALAERTIAAIPTNRLVQPEDVARDIAFLASPENRHTTGAMIVSDGGLSLTSLMNPGRRS
jgi:glucose 1-dehydrogenase